MGGNAPQPLKGIGRHGGKLMKSMSYAAAIATSGVGTPLAEG
jgi:hypothetical protein